MAQRSRERDRILKTPGSTELEMANIETEENQLRTEPTLFADSM